MYFAKNHPGFESFSKLQNSFRKGTKTRTWTGKKQV